MAENSFDIVSKLDMQEVSNAVQNATKEVITRFDKVLDGRAEAEEVLDQLEPVGRVGRVGVVQAAGLELGRVDRAVSHRSRAG